MKGLHAKCGLQKSAQDPLICLPTGNHGNNFRIHVSSGLLMRGPRALDRETNSSHVLVVEAYNHDLGPMRSSVRVRSRVGRHIGPSTALDAEGC